MTGYEMNDLLDALDCSVVSCPGYERPPKTHGELLLNEAFSEPHHQHFVSHLKKLRQRVDKLEAKCGED
jgi:hypothetical protein